MATITEDLSKAIAASLANVAENGGKIMLLVKMKHSDGKQRNVTITIVESSGDESKIADAIDFDELIADSVRKEIEKRNPERN